MSCSKDPDVLAIQAVLEEVRSACERKELERALSFVTEDYSDNLGQSKAQLIPRLGRMFGGYDRLDVRLTVSKIEKQAISARVVTKIKIDGFRGESRERLFGSPIAAKDLHIDVEKRGGEWKIVGSSLVQRRGLF
jgi:hypothetical protein